jgi:hypothetical protein
MSDPIISLRAESIAAQTMRFDLAKFKLVTTAVLGSIAIGAGTTSGTEKFPYIMGLIPLVCIYIDLIADSKQIQILVIGAFLKTEKAGIFSRYEKYCSDLRSRKDIFIDSYAFYFSTMVLCIAIALFGIGQLFLIEDYVRVEVLIEIVSGLSGIVLSTLLNLRTKVRTDYLK